MGCHRSAALASKLRASAILKGADARGRTHFRAVRCQLAPPYADPLAVATTRKVKLLHQRGSHVVREPRVDELRNAVSQPVVSACRFRARTVTTLSRE